MTTPIPVEELPGPRALPLIGNLLDLDAASPFVALMDPGRGVPGGHLGG